MPFATRLQQSPNTEEVTFLRDRALKAFVRELAAREKSNLLRVVLSGSVARGTDRVDSDIDVFVLLREGGKIETVRRIVDIAVDADCDYGDYKTHTSPFVSNQHDYERDIKTGIPAYREIEKEGVVLYDVER